MTSKKDETVNPDDTSGTIWFYNFSHVESVSSSRFGLIIERGGFIFNFSTFGLG